MSGHEELSSSGVEVMLLGTESPPATFANPTSTAHCAQIKSIEKLTKIKELRIRYLQDLIEIETFDKKSTDAAQLAFLIKEKTNTELEYTTKLSELKVLFPCPVNSCKHNTTNEINSF
ncbi:hypothetical protein TNIN_213561 [Trichonephila inaurata madagascariensis]|uniref:Uncharacterized protein n=1 Tax=Trichonephila inaurata madagascariensis TaxID=2747483 RepID=A0A8X6WUD2_9ARAC|nr:hypothetical protein TNIN_213561 [Trichonephila inaurata madagascariensis]